MIVHTLKMCTSYFVHILPVVCSALEVLNLNIFPFIMLRWCLVCVIVNFNCFHSLIQTLHNDCSYIVHLHLIFCAHFIDIFVIFRAVKLSHFYPSEMLTGCLLCLIFNSSSFHSYIFKLCILIVYTLNMCTLNFLHI